MTTVTPARFAAHADVQAIWRIAPCETISFPDCRVVRLNSGMEYELVKAPGVETEMVKWKRGVPYQNVDLLKGGEGNLSDLGDLDDRPLAEMVDWLSRYGLLGFRPPRALSHPELIHLIDRGRDRVHGSENRMYFTYEPVCLVREAVRIAKAASSLYQVIKIDDSQERQSRLAAILQMNPDTRACNEISMSVFGVPIGLHIQPKKPTEWTRVAVEGLAELTDRYLTGEFSLYWEEGKGNTRRLAYGWKVRSHFGALFLKMAHRSSGRRYCEICNEPLPSRSRPQTRTCSAKCRKQLQRRRASAA